MTILYSLLDDPGRHELLREAGINEVQIRAAHDRLADDARRSPPDFTFVGRKPASLRPGGDPVLHTLKVRVRNKSITLNDLHRTVRRQLLMGRPKFDAHGDVMLAAGPMSVVSRKLRALEPRQSYPQRKRMITAIIYSELQQCLPAVTAARRSAGLPPLSTSWRDGPRVSLAGSTMTYIPLLSSGSA